MWGRRSLPWRTRAIRRRGRDCITGAGGRRYRSDSLWLLLCAAAAPVRKGLRPTEQTKNVHDFLVFRSRFFFVLIFCPFALALVKRKRKLHRTRTQANASHLMSCLVSSALLTCHVCLSFPSCSYPGAGHNHHLAHTVARRTHTKPRGGRGGLSSDTHCPPTKERRSAFVKNATRKLKSREFVRI